MDRSSRQNINKETMALNDTLHHSDLTDIYRRFHPIPVKIHVFFFFKWTLNILHNGSHDINRIEGSLNKFKTIEITSFLTTNASKVMLKIVQAKLQQYVNQEIPVVKGGFRKDRGTRDKIANICGIIENAREFQKKKKHISASLTMLKPLTVWNTQTLKNSERDGNTRLPYLPPEKPVYRPRSNR